MWLPLHLRKIWNPRQSVDASKSPPLLVSQSSVRASDSRPLCILLTYYALAAHTPDPTQRRPERVQGTTEGSFDLASRRANESEDRTNILSKEMHMGMERLADKFEEKLEEMTGRLDNSFDKLGVWISESLSANLAVIIDSIGAKLTDAVGTLHMQDTTPIEDSQESYGIEHEGEGVHDDATHSQRVAMMEGDDYEMQVRLEEREAGFSS